MKNLLYIFLLLPVLALGQTTSQNYIKTIIYKDSADVAKINTSVTYFDGLGRPVQQIAGKQSGTSKDVITHIEYDGFGRQTREYLSFVATTDNLAFNASAQANTVTFYDKSGFENTENPWSEKFLEASPLGRVMKQGAPGTLWLGNVGNDNDHTVKFAYLSNTADDGVKKLTAITGAPDSNGVYDISFVSNGTYDAGKLYKTITQDENKASAVYTGNVMNNKFNTTEEYKNLQGQVMLKRTFVHANDFGRPGYGALDTYYVYDQYGNLTYVLPPAAQGSMSKPELCYQYKYDSRNRLIEKKLPGKTWEFIVYDSQDRVVATGPSLNPWGLTIPTSAGWAVTTYDAFGRVAFTGWFPETGTFTSTRRKDLQSNSYAVAVKATSGLSIDGVIVYYSNPLPTSLVNIKSTFKILTVNYYDNYIFTGAPTSGILTTPVEDQKLSKNVRGLSTGSWVRALTLQSQISGETTYTLYDRKNRPVRSRTTNYLGGHMEVDSKLDFDGTVQYVINKHKRSNAATDEVITTRDDFEYTAQDRLLSQTHTIGEEDPELMAYSTYNSIGQLTTKKVGRTSTAPLQVVSYKYNIRGWLTDINNVNDLNPDWDTYPFAGTPQDLFSFKINYTSTPENYLSGSVTPLYNGNICETTWRTSSDNIKRRYGYHYDDINRLTNAFYQIPDATVPLRNSYDESLAYDRNGNIKSLHRLGELDSETTGVEIDNLTYTYNTNNPNQLTKVTDDTNNPAGFSDVDVAGVPDYTYDIYGNIKTDKNKYITAITYNHLNLPVTITISGNPDTANNGTISYFYNSVGIKLKKTVTPAIGNPVETDYVNGYQYVGGVLEFFPTSEGYVKNTVVNGANNYSYVFQYKDHLGNNRVSYTLGTDNALKILEEDHYYPFGLKHNGYSANQQIIVSTCPPGKICIGQPGPVTITPVITPADVTYKYMYNGKELQDELGVGTYDYGWRQYDPSIGRFNKIDRFAEKYPSLTTYSYAGNNPIYFVDVQGDSIRTHFYQPKSERRSNTIPDAVQKMFNEEFGITVGYNAKTSMLYYAGEYESGLSQSETATSRLSDALKDTNTGDDSDKYGTLMFGNNMKGIKNGDVDGGQWNTTGGIYSNGVTQIDIGDFDYSGKLKNMSYSSALNPRAFNLARVFEHEYLGGHQWLSIGAGGDGGEYTMGKVVEATNLFARERNLPERLHYGSGTIFFGNTTDYQSNGGQRRAVKGMVNGTISNNLFVKTKE